ncbi:hypothetical protein KEM54_006832 [Ascosphaera aggregata]|nr:hypothetical protein KEM54_006832 [Ascosphaera aggregata]
MREDSILITCIAGAFAALSVDAIIFPFDTLRTRLQAPDYAKRFRNQTTGIVNRAALFRGLYQGVGTTALAMIPSSLQEDVNVGNPDFPGPRCFFLNRGGGILRDYHTSGGAETECTDASFFEIIKADEKLKSADLQSLEGAAAASLEGLPSHAYQESSDDRRLSERWLAKQGRTIKQHYNAVNSIPLFERTVIAALSASVSGSVAAFLVTPVDVVKTRMMLGDESNLTKTRARTEMLTILRQVYAENGISGLFRGASIRSAWAAVGTGLYLSSYEWAKVMLHNVKP